MKIAWFYVILFALCILLVMRVSKLNERIDELENYVDDCPTQEDFKAWTKKQEILNKGGFSALHQEAKKNPSL